MPRNTSNSRATGPSGQIAADTSQSRRRQPPKTVSFEDEQGNAAAARSQQRQEQEKVRLTETKAKAAADRATLREY